MKKLNFDLIYRIIVILLLTSILFLVNYKINQVITEIDTIKPQIENHIGKFTRLNDGSILDTETGEVKYHNGGSLN